jgi:hypothetical protein
LPKAPRGRIADDYGVTALRPCTVNDGLSWFAKLDTVLMGNARTIEMAGDARNNWPPKVIDQAVMNLALLE